MIEKDALVKVKRALNDANVGPSVLALRLTPLCNLNCVYCKGGFVKKNYLAAEIRKDDKFSKIIRLVRDSFFSIKRPKSRYHIGVPSTDNRARTMNLQQLRLLFMQAKEIGVSEIDLNILDGEPFMRKDIREIIKEIKNMGFKGTITTNGSLLNKDVANIMNSYKWDTIFISIDSLIPSIQYTLRPSRDNRLYMDNLISFVKILENMKSEVNIFVNTVVTRVNYKHITDLISFFKKFSVVKKVFLLKLINPGLERSIWEKISLTLDEEYELMSRLEKFRGDSFVEGIEQWGNYGEEKGEVKERVKAKCFLNYFMISVDYNGTVIQCPQINISIGSDVTITHLADIWRKRHLALREKLSESAECMEMCCAPLKEINNCIQDFLEMS